MREVVVVGAGPAGLRAAENACQAGAFVTLVDSSDELGGQFWRHLPAARAAADEHRLHHEWSVFQRLRASLDAHPHCRILTSADVWAIEPDVTAGAGLAVQVIAGAADDSGRLRLTLLPDALVLATGAHDRVLPFPGWDLPGVFSAGAAQALAKGERVAVGSRVLVAGAGPFLLPVAASLTQVGATVVGVHEAARPKQLARGWLQKSWQMVGFTGKLLELAEYAAGHVRHRIPYRTGSAVIAAHGTDAVEAVTVARLDEGWRPIAGTARRIAVDAVCIGHGFTPRLELPIAAGCAIGEDRYVTVDALQRTNVAEVYAAGEITGIGGMPLSAAEGAVAGLAAAGVTPPKALLAQRDRQRHFASRLAAAHAIRPGWRAWLTEDTLVCRCEEVTYSALHAPAAGRSRGLRSRKLTTRAGLGICQGRMCGRTVEDLLGEDQPLLGAMTTDRRPIAIPIKLGDLAAESTTDTAALEGTT
ncbi:FAD-dependent oxidoreductase [Flexivirga meconopsidis]|uniref:FAD-dependent oxidoreductase n=1 Tax=Flexivirga meconopsidis TaxID=2977121 RepID=UPI00223F5097|nr:FAD-dependent oxidoreductase [Flexivirga meconopsidis]